MGRTPNSKDIKIKRDTVKKGTEKPFLCCYTDNLSAAMISLSHSAFKVYVSLLFNRDGYTLNYSPQHVSDITGLCVETCRKGLNELIEKKYVLPVEGKSSLYTFYETQQNTSVAAATTNEPVSTLSKGIYENYRIDPTTGYREHLIPVREAKPRVPQRLNPDDYFDD